MKETGEQAKPKTSSTTPATPATPATTRPARAPLSLHHLQRTAGNAAVSRLVAQRYTPPVKPPPAQAPGMRRVNADIGAKKQKLAAHPAPTAESRAAQDAAVAPPDDRQAQAKTQQAEKMNAAEPGDFDKAAFIAAVNQAVEAQAPKNLDEADKFSDSGNADRIKDEVDGKVADGKDTSSEDIATATGETPDTSNTTEKDVTPLTADQPPGNPGAPNAGDAVPDRQPEEVTDFSEGQRDTEQRMAEADVTEEQLARGNEPDFDHALAEKKQGEEETAAAPAQARAAENTELQTAKSGAAAAGAQAMAGLTATREATGRQVDSGKTETKSADEQKREQVTATLQKVFDRTKTDVEKILDSLDGKVDTQFTNGEKRARDAFTADHERRMKAYKDKRYSGLRGKARWVKDKFAGLPEEANGIYQESRKLYVNQMQGVISDIADTIGRELGRAKTRIGQGRAELQAEVGKLPADLRRFGEEAAQDFAGQFDDLETQVDEKSEQLVQDLAQKYTEALDAIDEEITALQEANKGLWDRVKDAVVGVIQTIIELTNALMGILAKAASAVSKIIKDPIGFLGNVVRYVGDGLNLFTANIEQHLKTGLVSWLLGTAVKTGLQIPAKFDAKGIVQLLASLLGLTWDTIRAKIVRKGVPDKAMATVEKSIPEAQALQREGPAGLTKEITGESGDLKKTILDDLKSYLIPTVIVAGIAWIVSLLTPASAFVRAVKGIIDIVTFIVTQAAQITDFMNAILDAVIAIADGAASGVPKLIESALSTSIPLLLGFLAALLGIGSLATKVRSVFQKVSRPVGRAIDKIITRIAKAGKRIWSKTKGKPDDNSRDSAGLNQKSHEGKDRIAGLAARDAYRRISSGARLTDIVAILNSTLAKWRAKGVKKLSLESAGGNSFIVWAEVNPKKPSPESSWDPNEGNVKHLLSFKQARESGSTTWATGTFVIDSREGMNFGPSKSKPLVAAREQAEANEKSHAEEAVIARFKVFWENYKSANPGLGEGAPGGVSVQLDLHVGCSCCVNCADYVAGFVDELKRQGCTVNATTRFASLYMGGQMAGPRANPTVVPESTVDRHRELFEIFLGKSMMEPGRGMLSPADPSRYWGSDKEIQGRDPKDEDWYTIRRKKEQGMLALGILGNAGVDVNILDESHLSDEQISNAQRLNIATASGALNKAMQEVNEKLEGMSAGK
ncbi:hypothetical protein [Streptomyces harbinensis]|uniref:hypothetical protein n=1 Tax=Streptomyces harbinensis TaxID=1176198 RepID=UPI0036AECFE4